MTNRLRARKQRSASLNNWLWWTPVLAAPFAVALCEIYLATQMRLNDYASGDINNEIRQIEKDIESLRVEKARFENLERLEIAAPDLGLVVPAPNQVRTILYDARHDAVLAPDALPGVQYADASPAPGPLPLIPVPQGTTAAEPGEAMPALEYPGGGIVAPATRHATMPHVASDGTIAPEPLDESVDLLLGVL